MTSPKPLMRIPQREADALLSKVLEFRAECEQYEKPEDVNRLLQLFPKVAIEDGYLLDYVVLGGGVAAWIRPYARERKEPPWSSAPEVVHLFDRERIAGYRHPREHDRLEVDTLYRRLSYEESPSGLLQYAFFVVELWATRASWHAAEWLDSTPIFTKRRFDSFLERTPPLQPPRRPDSYGPLVYPDDKGGQVRFLVHSPVGMERIYYLECDVLADGRVESKAGEILAELAGGFIY